MSERVVADIVFVGCVGEYEDDRTSRAMYR